MVLLEDVVHLGHVLAADGFDDVPLVIGGVKASATSALSFTHEGRASGQRVLPTHEGQRLYNTQLKYQEIFYTIPDK